MTSISGLFAGTIGQFRNRRSLGGRKKFTWLIAALPALIGGLLLGGCSTYEISELHPTGGSASPQAARAPREPADVQILKADVVDKHYQVIGTLTAKAKIVTSWVRYPDRNDVDRELRKAAAKAGADAVIRVRYWTEPQGFESHGTVVGQGLAVYFQ